MVSSLPMLFCELSVSVKKTLIEKKTIQRSCRGFKLDIFIDTITSPGATSLSVHHVLNLFLEQSDTWFIIEPMIWSEGNIKATREIILGYTMLSSTISWTGKNEPDAVTVKMTVICRLSSTPLIGTVFEPFKSNVYFPGET